MTTPPPDPGGATMLLALSEIRVGDRVRRSESDPRTSPLPPGAAAVSDPITPPAGVPGPTAADMRPDLLELLRWYGSNSAFEQERTIIRRLAAAESARDAVTAERDKVLAERNQLSVELTQAQLALEPLAGIYDAFLEAKGDAWCRHWASVPLNQLVGDEVKFRTPTLEDCRQAKLAAEGDKGRWQECPACLAGVGRKGE